MLLALLVAFAAVVAPSIAARPNAAAAAPAPSSSSDEVLHPTSLFDDIGHLIGEIPDLPLPRILPCPPAFPKIPLIPCGKPSEVTECRPSLAKYMPACASFLTGGEPSPPKRCCKSVGALVGDLGSSSLCVCHVMNGEADRLFQAPVNHTRAISFMELCGYDIIRPEEAPEFCGRIDP
nr:unnamed protein product [Digitaria exilis]